MPMAASTLRKNLFSKDRRCHWCGRETWLGHGTRRPEMTKYQAATVDHVKCRAESATHAEYISRENKVLACYLCNQQRNEIFMASNPSAKCAWVIASPADAELAARNLGRLRRKMTKWEMRVVSAPATGMTHY